MESYASLSLTSINLFSTANKVVFPELCGPLGITDVDLYCATRTSDVCCGLCPNQSVNGPGQFIWAIVSYAIAAYTYTLVPSEVWGLAVMQVVNANAFIATGLVRVVLGASAGGMTRYHTQFLWPQALGFIYIMSPAILAPNWSRVGLSQKDMEERVREKAKISLSRARRSHVREVEAALYKKHHDRWSYPIFAFWILNMSIWTALYVWITVASIEFSQANCEDSDVLEMILSPTVVSTLHSPEVLGYVNDEPWLLTAHISGPQLTPPRLAAVAIILGVLAWLLVAFDGFLVMRKEKQGGSDFIIDTFLSKGKSRSMKEHRRLERRITIGTTLGLFVLWLFLNCWLWIEGFQKFYLSGADWMTFGQVEQITALFPDLLALAAGISGYLGTRDDLRLSRAEVQNFVARRTSMQNTRRSEGGNNIGATDEIALFSGPASSDNPVSPLSTRRSRIIDGDEDENVWDGHQAFSDTAGHHVEHATKPHSAQYPRAESGSTASNQLGTFPTGLPNPERGSLDTLRREWGLPPSSRKTEHTHPVSIDRNSMHEAKQESLAKRHRSRSLQRSERSR